MYFDLDLTPQETMVPRDPGSSGGTSNQQPFSADGSSGSQYQFDWLNWFYWNMWWQQYSYWVWSHNQASTSSWNAPQPAQQPDTNQQQNSQFNSYYPYQFNNPAVPQSWAGNYQGHPRVGGATAQTEVNGNFLTLQIRIINGFETCIAAAWKRLMAEVIDTVVFTLLLKAYLPDADLRIPEILFEGSDVWAAIEDEEEEIQRVLQTFLFSVFMQRMHHAIMESVWIAVFSCTPGKWMMGLRVLRCSVVHLTRTQPGRTIRVVPGGRITLITAVCRSLFKAIFSLFCPLVIFFFTLYRGQTKYDRIFRCAVVDTRTLYRPVHAGRSQGIPGPQMRQ